MKRYITTPITWIASLALVCVVYIIFAWDDWRMRRITRRAFK
jgi:hypothetical protein